MEAIELMNMIISVHDSFMEHMKNLVSQQFLIFSHISGKLLIETFAVNSKSPQNHGNFSKKDF